LQKKLKEMEEAQKNAWDELEQLSHKLQEERKKNMTNVISERMKAIKVSVGVLLYTTLYVYNCSYTNMPYSILIYILCMYT
jgi:hypothetical protein